MKRKIWFLLLASIVFFIGGSLLGQHHTQALANDCGPSKSGEFSLQCTTTKYMGGKWYKGTANYRSFADYNSVKTASTNARAHFEAVPGITITNWNGTGTNQIGVFDENHSYDSWTGLAEGSYIDGKYPDSNYFAIDILINTKNSNGTNAANYTATKLKGLMNHEWGHTWGIGHSTTSSRLMYCYDSRSSQTLTSTERGYLTDIY